MNALKRLGKGVELLTQKALGALFPDSCVGCKRFGVLLCNECGQNIHLPLISIEQDIIAAYFYQDRIVKEIIYQLKFRRRKMALDVLEDKLRDAFVIALAKFNIPKEESIVLIPIPLWHQREHERGFNQSMIIAEKISNGLPREITVREDILVRVRKTDPQTTMPTKSSRASNIQGCFRCVGDDMRNKTVIVIDDIVTTGATMNEAMKTLRKAGAKRVCGFAFAH